MVIEPPVHSKHVKLLFSGISACACIYAQNIAFNTNLLFGCTVPPETIYPLGLGKTLSLPKGSAANSLHLDEFLNLVTECCGKPDSVYRG